MKRSLAYFLWGRMGLGMTAALALPLGYELWTGGDNAFRWLLLCLGYGCVSWGLIKQGRGHRGQVTPAQAAQIMLVMWLFLSVLGIFPYMLVGKMWVWDAIFEAVSTVTSTGFTLLTAASPESLWLWRGVLGWSGGLTFLWQLVTLIPQASGCFGLTLAFRRGLMFSSVLTQMTARGRQIVWVYVAVTLLSWGLYSLAGGGFLLALESAMLIISTTGGTMRILLTDDNRWLEIVTFATCFLASGNFLSYWRTFKRRDFRDYYRNPEVRFLMWSVLISGGVLTWHLWLTTPYSLAEALRHGFLQVFSFMSTAGVQSVTVTDWPDLAQYILLLAAFFGGCIGSATGGLKAMRLLILGKILLAEVRRTLHPRMVTAITVGDTSVDTRILGRILCFFFLYVTVFFLFALLLTLSGLPLYQAVGLAAAAFTTVGTALSAMPPELSLWAKMVCSLFMLVGRVEIFAVLLLLNFITRDAAINWRKGRAKRK